MALYDFGTLRPRLGRASVDRMIELAEVDDGVDDATGAPGADRVLRILTLEPG